MPWWREKIYYRRIFYVLLAVFAAFLVYLVRGILPAFLLAGVLVYLLNPLVDAVEKKGTRRVPAILLVYLAAVTIAAALVLYVAPRMVEQLNSLARAIPVYTEQAQALGADIEERYTRAGLPGEMKEIIDHQFNRMEKELLTIAERAAAGIMGLVGHLFNIFLAPILAFYLLKDLGHFKSEFTRLLPVRWRMDALELLHDINRVLRSYIQGYLLVCVIVGVVTGLTLAFLGVDFALTLGIFAGLTELIPYFGPVIGAVPAVSLALLESKWLALKVVLVFLVIHQLEGNILSPKILGDRVGLHPLAVIVFLLAGGKLYGLAGMLLAVPTAAVLKIFISFAWRKLSHVSQN